MGGEGGATVGGQVAASDRARSGRPGLVGKNLLYYFVAGTLIALVAQGLGANFVVVLAASMIGPAVLLLAVAILRYNGQL